MFNRYPQKIGLYIDASNLHFHTLALNMRVDFLRFKAHFEKRGDLLAYCGYYTAVEELANGDRPLQKLIDFLAYHGYTVVQKPMKEYYDANEQTTKRKGNIDVELTLDVAMHCARFDRVVLVTGDGDFTGLVNFVKARGTRVTVVSSMQGNMLSNDLRKAATDVIDLADIRADICNLPVP